MYRYIEMNEGINTANLSKVGTLGIGKRPLLRGGCYGEAGVFSFGFFFGGVGGLQHLYF